MKTRMRLALPMAVLLVLPTILKAQGGPPRGGSGGTPNVAQLLLDRKADLAISDEVAAKLDEISDRLVEKHAPLREEMQRIRASGGMRNMSDADRQAMRTRLQEAMRDNDAAFENEIKPLLTPEQVDQATKIISESRQRRRGRR